LENFYPKLKPNIELQKYIKIELNPVAERQR